MTKKVTLYIGLTLVVVVLAVLALVSHRAHQEDNARIMQHAGIILMPKPHDLPKLEFTDYNGKPVEQSQVQGRWSLVFFGYTFCPDICPTTLAELRKLEKDLPKKARDRMQVIFVTVDPARDNANQLKEYLQYFNPSFIGWRSSMEKTIELSKALSLPFIPPDTSKPGYLVQHSGNLAIIGPHGQQRGFIHSPLKVEDLAVALPRLVEQD